ncbi:MAG: nuclear transport factor 2 family protein [Novosphingobium sp.]|nr:nuclear transport factor 2 family protein [Novosphingobium sp.]
MARFTTEQATAIAAIQQTVNDWARELDVNNGLAVPALVTEDCAYTVGGTKRIGPAGVQEFYDQRLARLQATPEGVPTMRHIVSNLRVAFRSGREAGITFSLVFFSTAGQASGLEHADPAAVADVEMDLRAGDDGDWKIARFDSGQTFRRVAK